jgi:CHAT domain-containing protein/Tfp pilus assembly protein PilF
MKLTLCDGNSRRDLAWAGGLALLARLVVCLLALGVGGLLVTEAGWGQAGKPAKDLSPAERSRLRKEAATLTKKGVALYQQGRWIEAAKVWEQILEVNRKIYPEKEYPNGHGVLAAILNNVGFLFNQAGDYAKAEPYYREALAMCRKLYSLKVYPRGHIDLAFALDSLGCLLQNQGKYDEAEPLLAHALAMRRKLFPVERYPRGHDDLVASLNNLAFLFYTQGDYRKAEPFFRDALAMGRKLYSPKGHPNLAGSLSNLAMLLQDQGKYTEADTYYREALAMRRKLYPPGRFPDGHPDLAQSLNNLGNLLQGQGEYARAEPFFRDALAMYQKLYPSKHYPNGQPDLEVTLNNLAYLFYLQGKYKEAAPFYRDALAMARKLYPVARFPNGHPDLTVSVSNMATLLMAQGKYREAEPLYRETLAMRRKLYPPARYPDGHPGLATSLNNLGTLFLVQRKCDRAEPFYRDGLAMCRKLYPRQHYPDGHPDLALGLNNWGSLLFFQGKDTAAVAALGQGLAMYQKLADVFAETHAEAEALNYLASLPGTQHIFLSATLRLSKTDPAAHYAILWEGKAALARVLERRQRFLGGMRDPALRKKMEKLLEVRRQLAALVLTPAGSKGDQDRAKRLSRLTESKEALEKELAAKVPGQVRQKATYPGLVKALPSRSVFVDLFYYYRRAKDPRARSTAHYVAFLLAKGQPVRRIELGEARPITDALTAWRRDIEANRPSRAATQLRRLVWDKLAGYLPASLDTVYLCPDGELSALPWAALPGKKAGTVLLEEHAFALVPHGPFLVQQLTRPHKSADQRGVLLALGDVHYGRKPAPLLRTTDAPPPPRPAVRGPKNDTWPELPGSGVEVRGVAALARGLPHPLRVVERWDTAAGTRQLLADLPRATWAHLATHGYFAAPKSAVRKTLYQEPDFLLGLKGERRGVGARNPLTQSGLVLAGANRPRKETGDGGIVTAEAIAGLPLEKLELAVLSACETGLGESATGEGVFGLQRAFHLAGTKNVVASLWRVNDQAAAALMVLFYHYQWEKGQRPLVALRNAQLALYRHPKNLGKLARGRGLPNFAEEVEHVSSGPKETPTQGRAPVKFWAAFVLSGAGQ